MERIVDWLAWLFRREKHEISRKGLDRFLTRWLVWGQRYGDVSKGAVMVHCFHRSDAEPYFHDHPFAFWSLILWGGYWEHTRSGKKWYGPGRLLRRPADWQHRVEMPEGRKCWTLVWRGPKVRPWGFICPGKGWIPWRQHQANQDAGGPGCE